MSERSLQMLQQLSYSAREYTELTDSWILYHGFYENPMNWMYICENKFDRDFLLSAWNENIVLFRIYWKIHLSL